MNRCQRSQHHDLVAELLEGVDDDPPPRACEPRSCLRCWALMRGKTSIEDVALAEDALGPHVCEHNQKKIAVWIAKDADGEVRGGIRSATTEEISILTLSGWKYVSGHLGIHISKDRAAEAIGEICVRAHNAGLMHCDVDDRNPWPDADGPWRLEITLATLEVE